MANLKEQLEVALEKVNDALEVTSTNQYLKYHLTITRVEIERQLRNLNHQEGQ